MPFDFVLNTIDWSRFPSVEANAPATAWLTFQSHRGLAHNTLEAYSRGLDSFFQFLDTRHLGFKEVTRLDVAAYLQYLQQQNVTISNATLIHRVTVLRLFYTYLTEEEICERNPLTQNARTSPLIRRHHKLPWIPNDEDWQALLAAAKAERLRNRLMLALAYDAALRREELCSLASNDIDPAHRTLRIRAETTKGRRERIVPYSASSGTLLSLYLSDRRRLGTKRGPLFLSESRRNYSLPLSIWSWSKIVLRIARRAKVPQFSTHTLRHLCLTDLARAGWDIHEIATLAGHRSVQTTLLYIHLSGRDLSLKLAAGMSEIHAQRTRTLGEQLV